MTCDSHADGCRGFYAQEQGRSERQRLRGEPQHPRPHHLRQPQSRRQCLPAHGRDPPRRAPFCIFAGHRDADPLSRCRGAQGTAAPLEGRLHAVPCGDFSLTSPRHARDHQLAREQAAALPAGRAAAHGVHRRRLADQPAALAPTGVAGQPGVLP